jgi:sulfur relay (sulfurtransferase) DsrC/TusE family protein
MPEIMILHNGNKIEEDLYKFLHRRNDPQTSRDAAKKTAKDLTALQWDVLHYIQDQGEHGCTDDELNIAFDCITSRYRSRRSELTKMGKIVPSGEKRATRGGSPANVWIHKKFMKGE